MGAKRWWMACVVSAGLGLSAPAKGSCVEVHGARMTLGELLVDVPEPWASLDMGAAPEPTQAARITRQDVIRRLERARMPMPPDVDLPRVLQVTRTGQVISEPQLTQLVRQELIHMLPAGSRIAAVRLTGGVVLPPGRVRLAIALPDVIEPGPHTWRVLVRSEATPTRRHAESDADAGPNDAVAVDAHVELAALPKRNRVPVIGRGSEVTVQVRSQGVLVQSSGLAQEAGSIGDTVGVLPNHGGRILHARVVDARTVEVRL